MFERIKTALVLLVIVGVCLFATSKPWPMLGLMLLTVGIGAKEWQNLLPKPAQWLTVALPVAALVVLGIPQAHVLLHDSKPMQPSLWPMLWVVDVAYWCVALGWVLVFPHKTPWFRQSTLIGIGFVQLLGATTAILALWAISPWVILYMFGLVWSADTGAYFAGRAFGQNKLLPRVSPGKTREGLAGGLALALVLMLGVAARLHLQGINLTTLLFFVAVSFLTVLASVLGDLVESMHKRQAGIKDSGTILPGHGGVLDRIDSILAAAPVFALALWSLMLLGINPFKNFFD